MAWNDEVERESIGLSRFGDSRLRIFRFWNGHGEPKERVSGIDSGVRCHWGHVDDVTGSDAFQCYMDFIKACSVRSCD
jgi:hypothetical protein